MSSERAGRAGFEVKLWHKLAAVCAAFGLPIAVLLYSLLAQQDKDIAFARKELLGTEYLRPCRQVFEQLLRHRAVAHARLAGRPVAAEEAARRPAAVEAALQALEAADQRLGPALSLPDRATAPLVAAVRQKWLDLKQHGGGLRPAESDERHAAAVADLRSLIALVGDSSNLILDPDLDSYYTMDTVLLKLPEGLDLAGRLLDFGEEKLAGGELSADDRTRFVVLSGLLGSLAGDLNSPLKGLPAAFKSDSTPDRSMQPALSPPLAAAVTAVNDWLDDVRRRVIDAARPAAKADEFAAQGAQALAAGFELWDRSADALDGLLKKRVAGFRANRWAALAGVAAALAVALGLVYAVSRGLTRQADAIRDLFRRLDAQDFHARAAVVSRDELGRVAGQLNESILPFIQSREERDDIQRSITRLLEEVSQVAEGDLTRQAEVTADVTGAVADAINNMVEQLRGLIGRVQDVTRRVRGSAGSVNATATDLARESDEQAQRIAKTAAVITNLSAAIRKTSEQSARSAEAAAQGLAMARDGGRAVRDTIQGMGRIREQVQETAKRLKRLGESSQEVGQITRLIDDIADRTGILALNASIQAAVAGDAGRGFAVVAEEIERLAQRSAEAVKQIEGLVLAIQGEAGDAVTAMEKGVQEVVSGSELANQAGRALGEIETVSERVAAQLGVMDKDARAQADGADAIAKSVTESAALTRRAAAGSRQAAAAVAELAGLADELRASVGNFRMPGGADADPAPAAPHGHRGNGTARKAPALAGR